MKMSFEQPQFTVDSVLFTVVDKQLRVLLVKRAIQPFANRWSLPGGFVDVNQDDNTEMTARRKLQDKASLTPHYLEQLKSFSGLNRDPRGFSVTLAYYALVPNADINASINTVSEAQWFAYGDIESTAIAFDHKHIIELAFERLQQKALYSMVPVYCCKAHFTLSELQSVIETIIGKSIQRKSLMRRVEQSNMFELVNEKVTSGGRKAQLYKLKKNVDIYHFERNLGA
jgi:ADP-ribose pyrophosphatase YjhB (NUDIX family)